MTTIADDERFKGGIHGLVLGCVLPVLAFNVMRWIQHNERQNKINSVIYVGIAIWEGWHIAGHRRAAKGR